MDLELLIFSLSLLVPIFINVCFFSYNILGLFFKKGTKGFKAIVSVFISILYFLLLYWLLENTWPSQKRVEGFMTFLLVLAFIVMPLLNLLNFKNYEISIRFFLVFSLLYSFVIFAIAFSVSYRI